MGEAFSWALTGAAILLVVYALRVIMQDKDPEKPGAKAGFGCSFFFLACLCWSLAAHRWVGGWLDAFRLGMGLFLMWPAIRAITKPHGLQLLVGVMGLVGGILLAGQPLVDLVNSNRDSLDNDLVELQEKEDALEDAVDDWAAEKMELIAGLQTNGDMSFEQLSQNPDAMEGLERLEEVTVLLDKGTERLTQVRALIADVEKRIQDEAKRDAGLDELLDQDISVPAEPSGTPVEEYAKEKRLKELFESLEAK